MQLPVSATLNTSRLTIGKRTTGNITTNADYLHLVHDGAIQIQTLWRLRCVVLILMPLPEPPIYC